MGLVERVQTLETERAALTESLAARDSAVDSLQAKLAASRTGHPPATADPSVPPAAEAAVTKVASAAPTPAASGSVGGWSAAGEKLDTLMELLGVAPEGDRVGRAARACERAKELRSTAARSAERVLQLEALRAEQVLSCPVQAKSASR
jgi:cell division septum initiation protein DivIVA